MFKSRLTSYFWKMIPLVYIDFQESVTSRHDLNVLSLIEDEELSLFTFDGLKRRLALHPETLSRILHRLEEEGIIKRETNGYKVTPKIAKLKFQESPSIYESNVPLLQTYLPTNIKVQQLVDSLKGKWFGRLRWFGLTQDDRGITLKWITEDGGIQINATIEDSLLTIEAKFLRDNNLNRALSASYQLMAYIGKIMPSRQLASHVGFFGDSDVFLMPA